MDNQGRGRRAKVLADKFIEGIAKNDEEKDTGREVHTVGKEKTRFRTNVSE